MRLLDLMRCVANNEFEADPKLGEDAIDIHQARAHSLVDCIRKGNEQLINN